MIDLPLAVLPPATQLLQWHKRRHAPLDGCRLYRIAPQSAAAPRYLVAKGVCTPRGSASLDPRGAFVLHSPASLAVWVGSACPEPFVAAAQRFAAQLQKYEGAPGPVTVLLQGSEPEAFWACLAAAVAEGSGSRAGSPAAPGSSGAAAATAAAEVLAAAVGAGGGQVQENSAYDKDFEVRCVCCGWLVAAGLLSAVVLAMQRPAGQFTACCVILNQLSPPHPPHPPIPPFPALRTLAVLPQQRRRLRRQRTQRRAQDSTGGRGPCCR